MNPAPAAIFLAALATAPWARAGEVARVPMPYAAATVDARYDASGALHVAMVSDGAVRYARRPPGGEFPAEPTPVLPEAPAPFPTHTLRPRIRVGPEAVYVMWMGRKMATVLARSSDGGQSWQRVDLSSVLAGRKVDVPSFARGPDGTLYLVWVLLSAPEQPGDRFAKPLEITVSRDGGATWSPPRTLTEQTRACPCCRPSIHAGPEVLRVAYRTSVENRKEVALLTSRDGGETFSPRQVSHDEWFFEGCPGAGPSLAVSGGHLVLAWTRDRSLRAVRSSDGGESFTPVTLLGEGNIHQATPGSEAPLLTWIAGRRRRFWRADASHPLRPRPPLPGAVVARPGGGFEFLSPRSR